MGDKTQKKETRRRENLFKYMRNIIEMADVHICKNVTVLAKLQNPRKKSCLETLNDAFTDTLRRSKYCLARKEKQRLLKLTKLCRRTTMV